MGEVVRRPLAVDDAISIWRYVAADDEHYANALIDRVDARLALLSDNPFLCQPRPELGDDLRSFTIGNYVLFYRPMATGVDLIRILHGARDIAEKAMR